VAEDAQGEAQGDPITLEGGDSANVDGMPHSGMLEQVSSSSILFTLTPLTRRITFPASNTPQLSDGPCPNLAIDLLVSKHVCAWRGLSDYLHALDLFVLLIVVLLSCLIILG
jgi:hypothetical protein